MGGRRSCSRKSSWWTYGQLDGVADQLDLTAQPADAGVVDVGDFLEDELFDLSLGDLLEDVAGAGFEHQRVTGADLDASQGLGETHDAFVVGVPDHEGALAVGEQLLEHDDLAHLLEVHHLERCSWPR